MKGLARVILGVLAIGLGRDAHAQGIVVDHNSVALFEQIPDQYIRAAADLTMVFINRSVGGNISHGLTCLNYESDAVAPSSCKNYIHPADSRYSSPASEVRWSRPGGYDRTRWVYYGWPGSGILPELPACGSTTDLWFNKLECFIRYVDLNPTQYRVYSYMNSYLEVEDTSDIASSTNGFFARQANRYDIGDFEAMEARHPSRIFIHHTSSLSRMTGNRVSMDFNNQMRDYIRSRTGKFLLDIADIESHDPSGNPCYDNRDGVPYVGLGGNSENFPDDGFNYPAVCQHYTPEIAGGHLGNPEVGKIRVAKAFWVLMARIAGWNPDGGTQQLPSRPTNLRITPGDPEQRVAEPGR